MDRRDDFVKEVMTMLADHQMVRDDVSCETIKSFEDELKIRIKMFQLRLPKLTKAQAKLNSK